MESLLITDVSGIDRLNDIKLKGRLTVNGLNFSDCDSDIKIKTFNIKDERFSIAEFAGSVGGYVEILDSHVIMLKRWEGSAEILIKQNFKEELKRIRNSIIKLDEREFICFIYQLLESYTYSVESRDCEVFIGPIKKLIAAFYLNSGLSNF